MINSTLDRPREVHAADAPSSVPAPPHRSATNPYTEPLLLLTLVLLGLVMQALNMFNYPGFTLTDDEGIYAGQAWSVLREGRLSPYTYIYDHAPAGWIAIAGWFGLTGGPHTFGGAIDSGRLLMLLLHLALIPLLYHLARKLGCATPVAALAVVPFVLSPLAIFYGRMLLLDNIMVFWLLLSLDLLLNGWGRLSRVALSGVCFGLALLSKETAIVFLPALLFVAVQERRRHQGRFAVAAWVVLLLVVASWYPLYALLKGELLGGGAVFSGGNTFGGSGISLLEALRWQLGRTGGGALNLHNEFWTLVRDDWWPRDPFLVVGGVVAVGVNLVRGVRDRRALAAGLLGALPLLYLARGGIVFGFYILAALPFLCLNLGLLIAPLFARLPRVAAAALGGGAVLALLGGYWQGGALRPLYVENQSGPGREALAYIKANIPADSRIIIRDDLWADLHEPGLGGPAFPNAHSHVKVATDPDVRQGVFHDDWHTVDYLVITPHLDQEFALEGNTVALDALHHGHQIASWSAQGDPRFQPNQVIELWKVDHPGPTERDLLTSTDRAIADRFEQDGAFAAADGTVTSEAQSYALLRAVWSDDRTTFNRTWAWTQAQLQRPDGLYSWRWQDGASRDTNSATDADADIALALLLAGKRWNDPALHDAGIRTVNAIWDHEVVTVGGRPYLTAGDWATQGDVLALNPSYFAPYAYRIFKDVDPDPRHDWWEVINTGYEILPTASNATLGSARSAGLPPDWVGIERATGALVPLPLSGNDTTRYGYDAARTYWRIALDLRWSGDGRADSYLRENAGFLREEVARKEAPSAIYAHDGTIVLEPPSLVGNAGALAMLLTTDPASANALYVDHFVKGVTRQGEEAHWGNPTDLYGQEWAWFAVAFYADALPDLWHSR